MDLFLESVPESGQLSVVVDLDIYQEISQLGLENFKVIADDGSAVLKDSIYIYPSTKPMKSGRCQKVCVFEDKVSHEFSDVFYIKKSELKNLPRLLPVLGLNIGSRKNSFSDLRKKTKIFFKDFNEILKNENSLTVEQTSLLNSSLSEIQGEIQGISRGEDIFSIVSSLGKKLSRELKNLKVVEFQKHLPVIDGTAILIKDNRNFFVLEAEFGANRELATILFFYIWKSILSELAILEEVKDSSKVKKLYESIFNSLPFPCLLVTSEAQVITHNREFDQLGVFVKNCLELKNEQVFESKGESYKINRKKVCHDKELILITFLRRDESNLSQGSEELGIISSSIAHELNNPIAGILAATSLLEMDEELSELDVEKVLEIKSSATRIKKLVEIFLGFSRAKLGESSQTKVEDCISHARELLKFRMAESNTHLNYKYEKQFEKEENVVNGSIFTMIFYILLSEVLTSRNHQKLLDHRESGSWEMKIIEKPKQVEFVLNITDKVNETLQKQKLLFHLLSLSGSSLNFEENKLRLRF